MGDCFIHTLAKPKVGEIILSGAEDVTVVASTNKLSTKSITLDPGSYMITLNANVTNNSGYGFLKCYNVTESELLNCTEARTSVYPYPSYTQYNNCTFPFKITESTKLSIQLWNTTDITFTNVEISAIQIA